jgi:hypothetical protein
LSPLLLVPLLLVAQTHAKWEASARLEVRARTATPQDNGTAAAGDLDLRPRVSGAIFNGPWTLSASYAPTLRAREFYVFDRNGAPWGDHSHLLALEGVWAKEGTARAFLGEYLRYGTLDLSTLNRESPGGVPTPPVEPVRSGLGLIQEFTTDTSAGVDWYLHQRLTLTTTAGFIYGGGADPASRVSLPLQSSPRAAARLAWLASTRDTIALSLAGQYVRFFQVPATATTPFNPGARLVILELAANYVRLLGTQTAIDVTVGGTFSYGQIPNTDPNVAGVYRTVDGLGPLVAAGFTHDEQLRAQKFNFRLNASLSPFVDRFAGTVYQRVQGGASLGWSDATHFSAALSAGVARSLPAGNEASLTTISAEAASGYQGDPWWRVDLSGRLSLVRQGPAPAVAGMPPNAAPPLETQWVVGLSLTLIAASEQPRTVQAE